MTTLNGWMAAKEGDGPVYSVTVQVDGSDQTEINRATGYIE